MQFLFLPTDGDVMRSAMLANTACDSAARRVFTCMVTIVRCLEYSWSDTPDRYLIYE